MPATSITRGRSCFLRTSPAMAADERVRRAVVPEWRLRRALELGDDALRELLPQLDAPLAERVDGPDHALREDAVPVERDQRPERLRGQPVGGDQRGRAVALERPGRRAR